MGTIQCSLLDLTSCVSFIRSSLVVLELVGNVGERSVAFVAVSGFGTLGHPFVGHHLDKDLLETGIVPRRHGIVEVVGPECHHLVDSRKTLG